jgi:hypothetical protein
MAAIDVELLTLIANRELNPWLTGPKTPGDQGFIPSNPLIGDLRREFSTWIGVDVQPSPDRTSIVVVKHARLVTHRNGSECVSSLYRVLQAHELEGSFTTQLRTIQELIDTERPYTQNVKLILDTTSVGLDLSLQWSQTLNGHEICIPVRLVQGEGRKLAKRSISDLLLTTRRAFQEGRVNLPRKYPPGQEMAFKRLAMQLCQRPVDFDPRSGLKALDDRSPTMNHYSLTTAVSCVVGQCETVDAIY